jgi:hypothetical protein
LTRQLILKEENFLHHFFHYLTKANLIDQPMSLEKRGLVLYQYIKEYQPAYLTQASIAWIEAGMSLKKQPAERIKTKHQTPPAHWEVLYGTYQENSRLCFLPTDEEGLHGYWFGFETETQRITPIFKAKS